MKTILKFLGLLLVVVLLIVAGRTLLIPSKQIARIPYTPETFDAQAAARKFSETITFPTVSWEGGGTEDQKKATQQAFAGFHAHLEKSFPQVYAKLDHETIGENNLLFTWKGSDPSLKPMLVMGHQDVVPIEAGTEGNWTHPPFSGDIDDGFIWGRGTLDDKMTVVGLLEAADISVGERLSAEANDLFCIRPGRGDRRVARRPIDRANAAIARCATWNSSRTRADFFRLG